MPHPRQTVGKRLDLICCPYAFQHQHVQPFLVLCQGPDSRAPQIKRQAGPVQPSQTPPPKRFRRKGSDASVSRVSLDSRDKLAMSRLDTLEMVSPPKVPTPKRLSMTPESTEETAVVLVDTPKGDTLSKPSSASERTRQFLKQKKEQRAKSATKSPLAKAKAKAKAKASSKKATPRKAGNKSAKARSTRLQLKKIVDGKQQPTAATAEDSTPSFKAKAKACPKAPSPKAKRKASPKAKPKASPKDQSKRARDQPAFEPPPPSEFEESELEDQGDEEDTVEIDKLAHKLYMRYWRSMNKSRFVCDSFACHYMRISKYLVAYKFS